MLLRWATCSQRVFGGQSLLLHQAKPPALQQQQQQQQQQKQQWPNSPFQGKRLPKRLLSSHRTQSAILQVSNGSDSGPWSGGYAYAWCTNGYPANVHQRMRKRTFLVALARIDLKTLTHLRAQLGQLCALQVPARKPYRAVRSQCASVCKSLSSIAPT
jgi:hypothetical protein